MHTLWNIILLAVAVFGISKLLPKIHIKGFTTAIFVAIVYSIINFLIGWLITLISLPAIIVTFGLFIFVVNAVLLWITDKIISDFEIEGITTTLLAAFLITMLHKVLLWIF